MEAQQISPQTTAHIPHDNTLLIVDDDRAFLARLARAMETRGFEVEAAASVEDGLTALRRRPPAFAVVDMRLDDGNGIDVIAALKDLRPEARAVVLTGYGNIATAVTAVKLGAVARRRRRRLQCSRRLDYREARATRESHVGGSRALGAHPARLRALQPQRLRDRAPAQYAPPDLAAHSRQARPEVAG